MARKARATADQIVARLLGVKVLIREMGGAMPSRAAELRREACEELDDLMKEVA